MASYCVSGPMCRSQNPWSIEDGTLERCLAPPPGPVCAMSPLYPSKDFLRLLLHLNGVNFPKQCMNIDADGLVIDARITLMRSTTIERGVMETIHGIIVHQTGGGTAQSALDSYKQTSANGAHFLIDKDGTIYQTASIYKKTWHVGKLKARCIMEKKCSATDAKALKKFNPSAEHEREMKKEYPERFPSNSDSIGIELVGKSVDGVYEAVTEEQNTSLQWLVKGLTDTLDIARSEIFRHPDVSRKTPSEASTAIW